MLNQFTPNQKPVKNSFYATIKASQHSVFRVVITIVLFLM